MSGAFAGQRIACVFQLERHQREAERLVSAAGGVPVTALERGAAGVATDGSAPVWLWLAAKRNVWAGSLEWLRAAASSGAAAPGPHSIALDESEAAPLRAFFEPAEAKRRHDALAGVPEVPLPAALARAIVVSDDETTTGDGRRRAAASRSQPPRSAVVDDDDDDDDDDHDGHDDDSGRAGAAATAAASGRAAALEDATVPLDADPEPSPSPGMSKRVRRSSQRSTVSVPAAVPIDPTAESSARRSLSVRRSAAKSSKPVTSASPADDDDSTRVSSARKDIDKTLRDHSESTVEKSSRLCSQSTHLRLAGKREWGAGNAPSGIAAAPAAVAAADSAAESGDKRKRSGASVKLAAKKAKPDAKKKKPQVKKTKKKPEESTSTADGAAKSYDWVDASAVRAVLTGIDDKTRAEARARKLDMIVVNDVKPNVTHVICFNDNRTQKVLLAICMRLWLVSGQWLQSADAPAKQLPNESRFEIAHFPGAKRARSGVDAPLAGQSVHISGTDTRLPVPLLKRLLRLLDAKAVSKVTSATDLIISAPNGVCSSRGGIADSEEPAPVVTEPYLLDCISNWREMPTDDYLKYDR